MESIIKAKKHIKLCPVSPDEWSVCKIYFLLLRCRCSLTSVTVSDKMGLDVPQKCRVTVGMLVYSLDRLFFRF
jgi:hypothetical protein